jgi:hypothetical protein
LFLPVVCTSDFVQRVDAFNQYFSLTCEKFLFEIGIQSMDDRLVVQEFGQHAHRKTLKLKSGEFLNIVNYEGFSKLMQ